MPDAPTTCLTCGDVAVAARIVEIAGDTATVEVAGALEEVGVELVGPVAAGDVVLCHAGIALAKLTSAP
jgi:hydrogenase maturation factor